MALQIRARVRTFSPDGVIELAGYERRGDQNYLLGAPVETPVPEGVLIDPFLTLDPTQSQQLMDDLWQCGVRPSEGRGSAGQLASIERHLADMRRLAFTALETEEP